MSVPGIAVGPDHASSSLELNEPEQYVALTQDVGGMTHSGQIKLRRIDGWRKIAAVLSQHTAVTT